MSTYFTHFHCHSHFSLLQGTASPQSLAQFAKEQGQSSIALTDTNSTSGLILFLEECHKLKIKPILGACLQQVHNPSDQFLLLAKNREGYSDLCQIISNYMCHHVENPLFKMASLLQEQNLNNLFVLSSTPSTLQELHSLVLPPNTLFAELVSQCPQSRKNAKEVESLASTLKLPLVASNNVHFLESHEHELHQVMRAIHYNASLSQLQDLAPKGAYFKSTEQMHTLFARLPQALQNTQYIQNCIVDDWQETPWIMPRIEVPPPFSDEEYLKHCAFQGLQKNYSQATEPQKEAYQQAVEIQNKELDVISKKGYSSYFLMVKQIRDWANEHFHKKYRKPKDCTILRGSAANSITLYNIGASDLDPIEHNLYFERFLNDDRVSPPDADIDFAWDERDEVLKHMIERFGEERCAMLCTTHTFRWKSAFREVAKVFGYTDSQITQLVEELKRLSVKKNNSETLSSHPDKNLQKIYALAKKLKGKPHFLGQHCGGMIITNQPIARHAGCQYSGGSTNRKIIQIDMHNGIDYLGLIKFDILGNGSLAVLRDALHQLEEQGILDPEVSDLQKCYQDPKVQELLTTQNARGIFYVESPAQMRLNQKCQAGSFEEIGMTSSLVRPASAPFTHTFVKRHRAQKQGLDNWSFLHPSLKSILGDTHDVIVFQEDVIRICVQIAGMGFYQADKVRKMMNSQHEGIPANYHQTEQDFIKGCITKHQYTTSQAQELWDRVASFKGFSFCQSHSLSYAQLTFKCAYLKAHYPAIFLASVISNNHGFYGTSVYIDEARRIGIELLPVCINQSNYQYQGNENSIRVGLMHIRGVQKAHILSFLEERQKNGSFHNFSHFIQRNSSFKTKEIEALIKVGAFAPASQPSLLASLYSKKTKSLENSLALNITSHIPNLPEVPFSQKCFQELYYLGYITSGHFLEMLNIHPAAEGSIAISSIEKNQNKLVKIFGSPITRRTHRVEHSGEVMLFLTLQDISGCADLVLWPKVYEKFFSSTLDFSPLEVWGIPKEEEGAITFEVQYLRQPQWNPNQISLVRSWEKRLAHRNSQGSKKTARRISKASFLATGS